MMNIKANILGLVVLMLAVTSAHSAVVWQDEFNGPKIDTETWIWDVGDFGFGNGQMEYNTSRAKNSYVDNGSLIIEAFRENYFGAEFTSARLNTQGRFAFRYGTLEARIKMPDTENGLWPAFWLLGNNFPGINWPDCGEIDIVEMGSAGGITDGKQQERLNAAIHYSNISNNYEYAAEWIDAPVDLSLDYHLYRVEWTPDFLTFYLDGVQFATWNINQPYLTEFHQPHFPILNIAIGGWDPSYTGVYSPAGVTALPTAGSSAKMYVDWIRVEDNAYTEIFLGDDTAETGAFGIFTDTTPVNNALVYGDDTATNWPYSDEAALYVWENTMTDAAAPAAPSEGTNSWSFDIGTVGWFGAGVFLPNFRNMENYSDGFLHFDISATMSENIEIGIMSSRGGLSWVVIGDETSGLGFARDGNWHTVSIPLNRYSNCDFNTAQQIFAIRGVGGDGTMLSLDNIWYEPSVVRPRPSNGSFGVFTETPAHKDAGEYTLGVDGEFYVWGDPQTLTPIAQSPYEGTNSMSFTSAGLGWFGAAFTPTVKYDLSAFDNPNGKLNFAMKTSASTTFYVGMKSGNVIGPDSPWEPNTGPAGVGQVWIKFAPGSDPYGFVRDGNWHAIEIPIADIAGDTDLSQVSQLFQILGVDGEISDIELDDIYYAGGTAFETNVVAAVVQNGVGISWPSTDGSIYTVQWANASDTNGVWNSLGSDVEGDWTTKTVFDPFGSHQSRRYQVLETP
jgi:beta-glucanase (GH16 family)